MIKTSEQAVSPAYQKRILVGFCVAAGASVLGSRLLSQRWPVVTLSLGAIAIAVWHGAFDGALAQERFEPRWGERWRVLFPIIYLGLAAAVACAWWATPTASLLAFLLYSALHFGTEMQPQVSAGSLITGLAAGFVPIAAACHWWPGHVSAVFAAMLRGEGRESVFLTGAAGHLLWCVAVVVLGAALRQQDRRLMGITLLAAELVLFRFCSPIPAFAVFFCMWHTPEHMLSTSLNSEARFDPGRLRRNLGRGLLPWFTALTTLVVVCWFGRHEAGAYSATLFILLSALTVPHMVLAELCRRSEKATPHSNKMQLARRATVTAPW